jgi:hypothetical protein
MASRPPPRRTPPPPPPRLPQYVPLPPPTGLQPPEVDEEQALPGSPYPPCRTIADEQRERSEEIQRMGVTAYMAQFDTRDLEAPQQTVRGVANTRVEEYEIRR